MKREIKFRAWDEGKKIMHNDFQFIKSGNESNDWIVFSSKINPYGTDNNVFDNPYFQQQLKIMQFTELQDKNGKDIYEGDIVATPAKTKSVVEFDKGLFGLNHDYGTDRKSMLVSWGSECNLRCLYDGYHREIEVIGNIYENPELI